MNYEDLIGSQNYVDTISAQYLNQIGPIVQIFKLAKSEMKLNPIYNEELGSTRKYLRPYELHSIYRTNPFSWSFDNTIPKEVDDTLIFYFNFNSMVQTANSLKQSACTLKINALEPGWSIVKNNDHIRLFKAGTIEEVDLDLNIYTTLQDVANAINSSGSLICLFDDDDYSKAIPNFKEIEIKGSVLLKTFNLGFKDVTNTVDQGDLIYIPSTNALYEVNSAYPVNNTMYKYTSWQCNATRTHAYVNYEALKAYRYGLDDINATDVAHNAKQIKPVTPKPDTKQFPIDDIIKLMCGEIDEINLESLGDLSPEKQYLNSKQILDLVSKATEKLDNINGEEIDANN